jgi:Fe-S-cluster containining protein
VETNPEIVARRAVRLEEENWRFRTFVKMAKSRARIDTLAAELGRQVESRMDCTSCGACCRDNCIPVTEEEVERLARRVGTTVEAFRQAHMTRDDDGEPAIDARPCPFLSGTVCSVYEDRPDACRGYPYIGGNVAASMTGIIERAGACPIVFEMLEQLKTAVGFRRCTSGTSSDGEA